MENSSLIQDMQKMTKTANAAWLRFVQERHGKQDRVFCFIEGEDRVYYEPRIKKLTINAPIFIPCGGKSCVLEVYRKINNEEIKSTLKQILFFVDRDYDLEQVPSGIYVTDIYSIENFYSNWGTIASALQELMLIHPEDNNFIRAKGLYEKNFRTYSGFAIILNSFCYSIRKYEAENKIQYQNTAKFDNLKIRRYIEDSTNLETYHFKEISYQKLLKTCDIKYNINTEIFTANEENFTTDNHDNFRGEIRTRVHSGVSRASPPLD